MKRASRSVYAFRDALELYKVHQAVVINCVQKYWRGGISRFPPSEAATAGWVGDPDSRTKFQWPKRGSEAPQICRRA